jgi:large subunit ribosomal protein L25
MAEATLQVQTRTVKGKQGVKHLRNEGVVPGVLYGRGEEPSMLSVNLKEFMTLLHSNGRNVVVDLSIGDKKDKIKAFIYEIQHDPMSGEIIHIDLKHISLTEKITVTVPVHLTGIAFGVKNEGGILEHLMHSVEVSCLPSDIPANITIDVTGLHTGDVVHVRDLPRDKFEIVSDADNVTVHVVSPKLQVAVEKPEETGQAEPEVIGEKKEEA